MPTDFLAEHNISYAWVAGEFSGEVTKELLTEIESLEKEHPEGFNRFTDGSHVTHISARFDQVRNAARSRSKKYTGPPVKTAIWGPEQAVFGIGRVYAALLEQSNIAAKVFYTIEECADWIDVPVAVLQAHCDKVSRLSSGV